MKDTTKRNLDNTIKLLLGSPEMERIRLFLVADASSEKPEADEIVKFIGDQIRAHLIEHGRQVRDVASRRRGF